MQERIIEREREREREQSPFLEENVRRQKKLYKRRQVKDYSKEMYNCKYQIIQIMLCTRITLNHSVIS